MSTALPAAQARPEILADKPYAAGLSIEEIRRRYGLSRIVKLASNENPLGVPESVRRVLSAAADTVYRYPRGGNPELREKLAAVHGLPAENIVIGNGSDEIIDLLIRLKCRPGQDHVLACRPCFSVYGLQSRLSGVSFRQVEAWPDFTFPFEDFCAAADENTRVAFVTSPDNPSGRALEAARLAELAAALPPSCLLVVDEAYIDFTDDYARYQMLDRVNDRGNLAVLRTFSKSYGLAGLRLGFAALPAELAAAYWSARLPFSVNVLAEAAGRAALEDGDFLRRSRERVLVGRAELTAGLRARSFSVLPSQANFVMARVPRQGAQAGALFEMLLRRGVIIRHLKSFGLEDYVRVSVGLPEEHEALFAALDDIYGNRP